MRGQATAPGRPPGGRASAVPPADGGSQRRLPRPVGVEVTSYGEPGRLAFARPSSDGEEHSEYRRGTRTPDNGCRAHAAAAGAGSPGSRIPSSCRPPASLDRIPYPPRSNTKGRCHPLTGALRPWPSSRRAPMPARCRSCGAPARPFRALSGPVRRVFRERGSHPFRAWIPGVSGASGEGSGWATPASSSWT